MMGDCMGDVRRQLDAEGPAIHLPAHGCSSICSILRGQEADTSEVLSDIAFAYDGTIMMIMSADELYPARCRAVEAVADVFASRGHMLNIGVAKTIVLLSMRGRGGKKARQYAWRECGGHATADARLLGRIRIPV
eukprot:1267327-Pyramimonas_sp.AAC.1